MIGSRVELRLEGLMLERLLNRAVAEGAKIARVRRLDSRSVSAVLDERSAAILLALAERFSVPARETDYGLRLGKRVRSRWTLFPALVICAALVTLLLSRVWFVRVRAPEDVSAPMLALLEDLGVRPGMAASDVQPDGLALELSALADGYSHISVRLEGVWLIVDAVPETEPPEVFQLDHARDLVADRDGIVISVTALSGNACVKPGDVVRRGDVLIRGEEQLTREENRGVAALGEVVARAWHTGTAELPATGIRREYTGRRSVSGALSLFGLEIPLSEGQTFERAETETEYLPVGGMFLPLAIRRATSAEYEEFPVEIQRETLMSEAEALSAAEAKAKIDPPGAGGCRILDIWTEYTWTNGGTLRARTIVEYAADIAVTRDTLRQGG
jgi:similar to stage IV sporulation protein